MKQGSLGQHLCVSAVATTNLEIPSLGEGTDLSPSLMPSTLPGHTNEHLGSCSVLTLFSLLSSGYESPLQKEALEAVWISTWVSRV